MGSEEAGASDGAQMSRPHVAPFCSAILVYFYSALDNYLGNRFSYLWSLQFSFVPFAEFEPTLRIMIEALPQFRAG